MILVVYYLNIQMNSKETEYKVGQKVWFLRNNQVECYKIEAIEPGWLWFGCGEDWPFCLEVEHVAPTKEALRIKIFGE